MRPSRFTSEKRNFKRMTMNCPMSYQVVDSANRRTGTCVNLSANGILLECDQNFPVGTRLKVNVSLQTSLTQTFSAIVTVLRVASGIQEHNYQLAGTLDDIH